MLQLFKFTRSFTVAPFKGLNSIFNENFILQSNRIRQFHRLKNQRVNDLKPPSSYSAPSELPNRLPYFFKTTLFAAGFTGLCFSGGAILYYENVLKTKLIKTPKAFKTRERLNEIWNSLTKIEKYVITIISANVLVFIAWQIPRLRGFMAKYFLSYPKTEATYSSTFLSAFSHSSFAHLFFNMFALYSLSNTLEVALGAEQFLSFYFMTSYFTSFISNNIKLAGTVIRPSLGASGAIFACVAIVCMAFPNSEFAIIFLPFLPFKAEDLLKFVIAFDMIGLFFPRSPFDHVTHLAGTLFGIWYYKYGHQYLWEKQKYIIEQWHKYRSK